MRTEALIPKALRPEYESLLASVQKPSRYIGGGWNSVRRDEAYRSKSVGVCLCFPDLYETGFANAGIEILYRVINRRDDSYAERAYAADSDLAAALRGRGWPLFSLETRTPLKDFDIVGFGLPYELCFTNVLEMLDLGGIPLKAHERGKEDPLIIGGGPCVINPEPLADFFDGFVIGDGEEIFGEIIACMKAWKGSGASRTELLKSLARIEGFYVPSLYAVEYFPDGRVRSVTPTAEGVPASVAYRRSSLEAMEAPVVPFVQTVHDRLNVEIQRGCPWRCRFCQAGFSYRPYRERSKEDLLQIVEHGLKHTGYDAVTLAGLSAADHTEIVPLLQELSDKFSLRRVSIGLPSTRADRFTLAVAEILHSVRRQSLTFAPEGGTERMRRVIRKELQESEIRQTLSTAREHGWKSVKLYFMYGLPTETQEDLDGIVHLVSDSVKQNRGLALTLTLSPFVPKPHTPFQWHPMDTLDVHRKKLQDLRKRLAASIRAHGLEQIVVEGVLSRGDRRCGALLEYAWRTGSKFDEWSERFHFNVWQKAFAETGLTPEFFSQRVRTQDEVLPWDHIQGGPDKRALWNDYQTALKQAQESLPEKPHLKERPTVAPSRPVVLTSEKPVQRLRFRLSRHGDVRFLSHLEQIEMIRRMVRRAELPVAFTSGFHPQMKASFGPAISVGYESECELFDIELTQRLEPGQAFEKLSQEAPEGFSVLKASRVPLFFPSLESLLNRVEYRVRVPQDFLHAGGADLPAGLEEFLARKELTLEKIRKKGTAAETTVKIDLHPLILGAEWIMEESSPVLRLTLRFGPGKNAKPEKIAQLLLSLKDEDTARLAVERKAFWIEKPDGTLTEP